MRLLLLIVLSWLGGWAAYIGVFRQNPIHHDVLIMGFWSLLFGIPFCLLVIIPCAYLAMALFKERINEALLAVLAVALSGLYMSSIVGWPWANATALSFHVFAGVGSFIFGYGFLWAAGMRRVKVPRPLTAPWIALPMVAGLALLIVAAPALREWIDGEHLKPSYVFFRWVPGNGSLRVDDKRERDWLSGGMRDALMEAGFRGELQWSGDSGSGSVDVPDKLVVIAAERVPEPVKLHYAAEGTIAYLFDGKEWQQVPSDKPLADQYMWLVPNSAPRSVRVSELCRGCIRMHSDIVFHQLSRIGGNT